MAVLLGLLNLVILRVFQRIYYSYMPSIFWDPNVFASAVEASAVDCRFAKVHTIKNAVQRQRCLDVTVLRESSAVGACLLHQLQRVIVTVHGNFAGAMHVHPLPVLE